MGDDSFYACQCTDFGHVVQLSYDADDGDVTLYFQMNRWAPFWKRLAMCFRFLFLQSRGYADGHYDCITLQEDDYARLHRLLDQAEARKRELRLAPIAGLTLGIAAPQPADVDEAALRALEQAALKGPLPSARKTSGLEMG